MDKVIKINDIEYIRKSEYDKAKKDVDNIKQLVSSSIAGLNDFLGNQVIAQSVTQITEQPITKKERQSYKQKKVTSKRSKNLVFRKGAQQLYKIEKMDKDGHFYTWKNKKCNFSIRDVIGIQKIYDSKIDNKKIEKIAKRYSLSVDIIQRIIYNIDANIFDEHIREYLSSANDIEVKPKTVEQQNNPQKRKEAGYS